MKQRETCPPAGQEIPDRNSVESLTGFVFRCEQFDLAAASLRPTHDEAVQSILQSARRGEPPGLGGRNDPARIEYMCFRQLKAGF